MGILGVCYEVHRNPDSAELIGNYLPKESIDVLSKVGELIAPAGDAIIDMAGVPAAVKPAAPVPALSPPVPSAAPAKQIEEEEVEEVAKAVQEKQLLDVPVGVMKDALSRSGSVLDLEEERAAARATQEEEALAAAVSIVEPESPVNETSLAIVKSANKELESISPSAILASKISTSSLPEVSAETELSSRLISSDLTAAISDELTTQSAALKKEVETAVLRNDNSWQSSQNAHRSRLNHLAGDVFEQVTWASVRSGISLQALESDLEHQYKTLLLQQKEELDLALRQIVLDKEREAFESASKEAQELLSKYEGQFTDAIKAQADGFHATFEKDMKEELEVLQKDLQTQMDEQLQKVNKTHADHLHLIKPQIDTLSSSLSSFSDAVAAVTSASQQSKIQQTKSQSILVLDKLLSTSDHLSLPNLREAITTEVDELQKLSGDELTRTVIGSLQSQGVLREGACSLSELQVRFAVMRDEMRKVALNPNFPDPFLGQLIGNIAAFVLPPPKDFLLGPGLEDVLARAAFHVERGRLKEAISELDDGVPQGSFGSKLMADWRNKAIDRLTVDQSIKVLKAVAIVRSKESSR